MSGRMFATSSVAPTGRRYSESFKRQLVEEYESGGVNKNDLMRKYNLGGHSQLLDWCRQTCSDCVKKSNLLSTFHL